jgi:hypothetical protein
MMDEAAQFFSFGWMADMDELDILTMVRLPYIHIT